MAKTYKYSKAQFDIFLPMAIEGDVQMQEIIADCYRYHYVKEVRRNHKKANEWYQKAADNGSGYGYYSIGIAYAKSAKRFGVAKDSNKAIEYLKKAVELGYDLADFFLGMEYKSIKDYYNAKICLNRYVYHYQYANGHVLAELGEIYFKEQDYSNALDCFLRSPRESKSKRYLSIMYKKGLGVEPDKKKAREIYQSIPFMERNKILVIVLFLAGFTIGLLTPTVIIPRVRVLEGRFYPESENYKNKFGYQYVKDLSSNMANLYRDMYYVNVGVKHRSLDLSKRDDFHKNTIASFNYHLYGLSFKQAMFVSDLFCYDNAEFHWIMNETYDTKFHTIDLVNDKSEATKKQRDAISNELAKIDLEVDNIMRPLENASTLVRVSALYDFILDHLDYAYDANHIASKEHYAHSLVALIDGKGVCEAYSKAFTYYCNKYNINCLPVIGKVSDEEGIGHAWNMVELDGQWYIFDITSADGYVAYYSDNAYRSCFAITKAQYNEFIWKDYEIIYGFENYRYEDFYPETASKAYLQDDSFVYAYDFKKNSMSITGYVGSGTSLTIPESYLSYPITTVSSYALEGVKELTIEHELEDLNLYSESLEKVVTGASIKPKYSSISPFFGCPHLHELVFTDAITKIDYTFYGNTEIRKVTLGKNITEVDRYAFRGYGDSSYFYQMTEVINKSSLDITVGGEEGGYVAEHALFVTNDESKAGTFTDDRGVVTYSNDDINCLIVIEENLTKVTIPSTITSIKAHACYYNNIIQEVTIPDSVKSIYGNAFSHCMNLRKVSIGKGLEYIYTDVFTYDPLLTSLTIDSGNPNFTIENDCLFTKTSKQLVAVAQGKETINVPEGVTSIENCSMQGGNYRTVNIPSTVTKMNEKVFTGSTFLENINIDSGNTTFSSVDGLFYSRDKKTFYYCPQGKNNTDVRLSSEVITIKSYAFSDSSMMGVNVYLNEGLKTVPTSCFNHYRIKDLYLPSTLTIFRIYAFYKVIVDGTVFYNGTKAQFESITKSDYWNYDSFKQIKCNDGVYTIS